MKAGWQTDKLASVCEVFADGDWVESKDQSQDGVRLVQTGNVGLGEFKDRGEKARYISEETFKRLRCTEIHEGDCLVSRLPDPVGRACIIPDTGEKMITAVDCTIIRFKPEKVLPTFFNCYAQSREYLSAVASQSTGATRLRISRANLGEILVPTPPLPEQKRIVTILDQAFEGIATATANAEKNLANARELFEGELQAVFTRKGDGWVEKPFGEVCNFVRGPFGGSLKKSIFVADGFAIYEQQHAIYNQFSNIRYFISEQKFNEMKRFELRPNDLIMSCSGTMGCVAIVPEGIKRGIINQALLKLTPHNIVNGAFLKSWMISMAFQDALKEYSGGAAIQNVASVKVLKEIKVPIPPLHEQEKINAKLVELSAQTQKLEAIYQQKLEALDELKKSILNQAFTGQLQ
jgi:type I restriction enzyme S subunit